MILLRGIDLLDSVPLDLFICFTSIYIIIRYIKYILTIYYFTLYIVVCYETLSNFYNNFSKTLPQFQNYCTKGDRANKYVKRNFMFTGSVF